jgi:hypothetical protein
MDTTIGKASNHVPAITSPQFLSVILDQTARVAEQH